MSCLVPDSAMRVLVRRPEGKRLRGTPTHRWQGVIKIERQEMGWVMDWIDSGQVGKCECSNEPLGSIC